MATTELVASFDKPDVMISLVSSGFLWSINTVSVTVNCSLLLGSVFMNYVARMGHHFCLDYWWAKCQLLNWFSVFPVIQQHLGSRHICHQTRSLWILPIRRLIFRLALVQLLMTLWIQSSIFPILELHLSIPWPLYRILRIHELLYSAVSKQVGNTAFISIYFEFCFQAVL